MTYMKPVPDINPQKPGPSFPQKHLENVRFAMLHQDLAQGFGRLELIVALTLRDWAHVCSQSQDTRSAVIGGAQNS